MQQRGLYFTTLSAGSYYARAEVNTGTATVFPAAWVTFSVTTAPYVPPYVPPAPTPTPMSTPTPTPTPGPTPTPTSTTPTPTPTPTPPPPPPPPLPTHKGLTYGEWLGTYQASRVSYYDYLVSYGVLVRGLPEADAQSWAATLTPPPTATYKGMTYSEWLSAYLAGKVKYYDYMVSYGMLVLNLSEVQATAWAGARASP
jgi:hypothetical protein